jgi:hypothetical protein
MTTNNSENSHWTDLKDFGLPHVEIKPLPNEKFKTVEKNDLKQKEEEVLKKSEQIVQDDILDVLVAPTLFETNEPIQVVDLEEKEVLDDHEPTIHEEHKEAPIVFQTEELPPVPVKVNQPVQAFEEVQIPAMSVESEKKLVSPTQNKPKKNKAWIWIVFLLFLIACGGGYFQFQQEIKQITRPIIQKILEQNPFKSQSEQEIPILPSEPENSMSSADQSIGKEDVLKDSVPASNLQESNSQGGSVLSNSESIKIERITSRVDKPRYFIVVGSLPSERLAIKQAAVYVDRAPVLYLISPYGDNYNYRLSIGFFDSLVNATSELERIKSKYTEALWILKY